MSSPKRMEPAIIVVMAALTVGTGVLAASAAACPGNGLHVESGDRLTLSRDRRVVVNVKEYGATGDGVADDTTAIQSAIGALEAGDVLYFPEATYRITETLTIRNDYVTVVGDYAALYTNAATACALGVRGDDCEIYGLEIYGDGPTVKTSGDGINVCGDRGFVHDCFIHSLYARAVVLRGANCIAERIVARCCRKDMVTCKGRRATNCIVRACEAHQMGRSAVACDTDVANMQIIRCHAYNSGNTQYIAEHHNVFHFEDCNDGLVKDCTVYYDGNHDYCRNDDENLKYTIGLGASANIVIDGLEVIIEESFGFGTLTFWKLIDHYSGTSRSPIRMRGVQVYNNSNETLGAQLQVADIEMQDCRFYGPVAFTQLGAAAAITRMENVHVDGRGRTFDFYYPRYGLEPDCVIRGCTFENIDGWALRGRFEHCLIEHNTFRAVSAIGLLAKVTNASNRSNNTMIRANTFADCDVILNVWDGTTRDVHGNTFCGNVVAGVNGIVYSGTSPGTSVYWWGNRVAEGASWTTLATNCADTIHGDLSSDHEWLATTLADRLDEGQAVDSGRQWGSSGS